MPQFVPRDTPFDRALRRLRRDRSARTGTTDLFLHRRAEEDLLDRLSLVTRTFERALVIGCADHWLCKRLAEKGIEVIRSDPGAEYARAANGVQCDEDILPFADGAFDLIISLGTLDSVNDLPGALALIRKALRPDGLFLAALVGAGSLPRLRSAFRAAEEAFGLPASPRIHPQIDVRAAGDLLARAGFALPVVDSDGINVRYPSLRALVADLRKMAATNQLTLRAKNALSRPAFAAAIENFKAQSDVDGKTSERFEIVYLAGWGPAPSQPKPAKRGSATTSLAEALRPST